MHPTTCTICAAFQILGQKRPNCNQAHLRFITAFGFWVQDGPNAHHTRVTVSPRLSCGWVPAARFGTGSRPSFHGRYVNQPKRVKEGQHSGAIALGPFPSHASGSCQGAATPSHRFTFGTECPALKAALFPDVTVSSSLGGSTFPPFCIPSLPSRS